MSVPGMLPSGVPDLSLVQDFIHEKDARLTNDDGAPVESSIDLDALPEDYQAIERKLRAVGEEQPSSKGKKTETEDGEEPIKELYFCKVPRPDYESESHDLLQKEFEGYLAKVKKFAELRQEKIVERTKIREDQTKALDLLKEANRRVHEMKDVLKPYRDQSAKTREARRSIVDSKRSLPATTERQLDQSIKDLTFRLEHETISLAEEKEIPKRLKQLESSRKAVREFESKNAAFTEHMSNREHSPAEKEQLEKELKDFKDEQEVYQKMYNELKVVENQQNDEVKQISDKLDAAVKEKDFIYGKLSSARDRRKKNKTEWQENRKFSGFIRGLVQEGKIDEAQRYCEEQVNGYMERWNQNPEYRKEYAELWVNKRHNPMATFEENKAKNGQKGTGKKKSALHGDLKVLPGQSLSDAVVADVMKEAENDAKKTSTKKTKALGTTTKITNIQASTLASKQQDPVEPLRTAEKEKAEVKSTVRASVTSTKQKKVGGDNEFELPAVIAESTKARPEQNKEQEKEEGIVEEDLAEKKKQEQETRKEKEAEKRKKRAEAAKKKKEREEAELRAKHEAKAQEAQQKAAVIPPVKKTVNPPKKTGGHKKGDFKLAKTNVPTAKNPIRKQKQPLQRVQEIFDEYPVLITAALVLIAALIVYASWLS